MKKIYLILAMAITGISQAQYTLTSSMNPIVGDIEKTWDLDTTNLSTGSAGTSQIWNYTGITINPTTAVTSNSYVSKTSAPNYTAFPAAVNLAQTSDGQGYTMWGYTSSGMTIYGFTDPTFATAVYQNPETLITYPFTYGTISTDTYSTSFTYSGIPIAMNGTVTVTGDGMGTLNTPGNSYPNVLRLKVNEKSVTNAGSFGTSTTTAVNYIYVSSISKFSLLTVNTQTGSSSTSTTVTKSKTGSVSDMILAGIKENHKDANFSIYPNPATGKEVNLFFVLANSESYEVTVSNILGQEVTKINLGEKAPGIYNEKLELNNLQTGVYYIRLKGTKQEGVQKLVVE